MAQTNQLESINIDQLSTVTGGNFLDGVGHLWRAAQNGVVNVVNYATGTAPTLGADGAIPKPHTDDPFAKARKELAKP